MIERLLVLDPSNPKTAQFISSVIAPKTPDFEELKEILVTTRLELLYDFLMVCQTIAQYCSDLTMPSEYDTPDIWNE